MQSKLWSCATAILAAAIPASPAAGSPLRVETSSATQLLTALERGETTSRALVSAYLSRIARIDRSGPRLNSVLAVNPNAVGDARRLDDERRASRPRGPLHGLPILVKDNIETLDALPTTAGSLALAGNFAGRDAPVVARLRAAGAVILGKANLSEWANIRSTRSISGWSAVGGFTRNAYAPNRSPCGSSAGSAVAVAAGLAAAAIGTETDGSITCPASINGVVGMKPTVGLLPGGGIVPISHSQDSAGPITATVRDAALLLTVMASGSPKAADYAAGLDPAALRGKRIGVMRFAAKFNPEVEALFDAALARMTAAGATLVEIDAFDRTGIGTAEHVVLMTEFRADLNAYLATTPPQVKARTLADLIAFNRAHADRELAWFGQETFEEAETTTGLADPAYRAARERAHRLAGPEGIDRMLAHDRLDLLVAPTTGPAWTIDRVAGDHFTGGGAGSIAAVAGYPHLTVPMGQVRGLPIGLSFIGPAWSEARLLAAGNAFEGLAPRLPRPLGRPID